MLSTMAKKSSDKICKALIRIWLATSIIYLLMVLAGNISMQATLFMRITTTLGCLFYVYTFYRKNRVLAVLAVISMVIDIVVACIRWLPRVSRLLILVPFIIWAIGIFWYTKIHGKKSMWVLGIIFIIYEILSVALAFLWIFVADNADENLAIFCENDIPYACTADCDIENNPLSNCECAAMDKELLWDYQCDWKTLKLFDSNWQLLWTFWE